MATGANEESTSPAEVVTMNPNNTAELSVI
jgi:hypothetical protein